MPTCDARGDNDCGSSVLVTRRLRVRGAVQGVGFRPFVFRLAAELGVAGWIRNDAQGVEIEACAAHGLLDRFGESLKLRAPAVAEVRSVEILTERAGGCGGGFVILDSLADGARTARILPDLAVCGDCLRELFNSHDRRHRYPFINCTNCGPRYSIVERIPYDRPNTTMKSFVMCDACRAEYENPLDRRFHAQPNACPVCGPHLACVNRGGDELALKDEALLMAAGAIREGRVVAVKGIGGFHLVVDARNEDAVRELRRRKHREEKPLALMYPAIEAVRRDAEVSAVEEALLLSPAAPIVLLRRASTGGAVTPGVAPRNPNLGIMLPYAPLHHLLLRELGFPVVATSGNLSDEPISTGDDEARERLGGLADLFLVHDRPIARPMDDSIVRVMAGQPVMLRRGRGYAPYSAPMPGAQGPVLAVGAHMKNTLAFAQGGEAVVSQHIGDLDTPEAFEAFKRAALALESLYETKPKLLVCDLHPDYRSTLYARERGIEYRPVQHHHAHIAACMAENEIEGRVLGIAWDGTGYGADGTIWGGEFLLATRREFSRFAHLRTFRLPGGDRAAREPRRSAAGLLFELLGAEAFASGGIAHGLLADAERPVLLSMLQRGVQSPWTSGAGRLFDAVAALLGIRKTASFEGQAAMELEFALDGVKEEGVYPFEICEGKAGPHIVDWGPSIRALLDDRVKEVPVGLISARFHNTLVRMMVETARQCGVKRVVLSGGCFQNRYLTERAVAKLSEAGFEVYRHSHVPPNDGGISLGQIASAVGATFKD